MRIAIISASTVDNFNTGMISVDLAAASLQSELKGTKFDWFMFPSPPGRKNNVNSFWEKHGETFGRYELPKDLNLLKKYDRIIYWGDFLNSRTFMRSGGAAQLRHLGMPEEEQRDTLLKCLLLRDQPDSVIARTILFGGSILPDRQSDYTDSSYPELFDRLVSRCAGIWMRDPVSAARVSMRRRPGESCLGTDAALTAPLPTSLPSSFEHPPKIGVFVGYRSRIPIHLEVLLERLKERLDVAPYWIRWFRKPAPQDETLRQTISRTIRTPNERKNAIPAIREHLCRKKIKTAISSMPGNQISGNEWRYEDTMDSLAQCQVVLSDTYHLCVNAWRLGIPAICLGDRLPSSASRASTIGDDKKLILYLTYQASDLYASVVDDEPERTAIRLCNTLDSEQPNDISQRIRQHAGRVRAGLIESLQQV